ncbi:MAG: hypothetical protein FJ029_14170 [Actinobacteria bacterium]|nr:hypothetical protein [Actinomycetota bacterium]
MQIKETVSADLWGQRPQRSRRISPEIRAIVKAVAKASAHEWVVLTLSDEEKKRQPTLRGRIESAALLEGIKVKFEMRGGDLGIQRT